MRFPRKMTAVAVFSFFVFIAISCPTPTPMPIYAGDLTIDTWNGRPVPYLNVPEDRIYNTSAALEYSLNDRVSWTDCNDSVVDVPGGFVVGHRVWTRVQDNASTEVFLGQIQAVSGRPDLRPNGKIHPGIYNDPYWSDYLFANAGQTHYLLYSFNNIGDTAASNANHRIRFYFSTDRIITTADTQVAEWTVSSLPVGQIPSTGYIFSFTVPSLNPGRYYIGMIVDATNVISELNEDNNVTTEDQVSEFFIRDPNNTVGAFKLVNSWGTTNPGSWENLADGHYWVTYDAMIAHNMAVFYYYNTVSPVYEPTVLAVFQITGLSKAAAKITIGLGSPSSPFIKKEFQARAGSTLLGGPTNFPNNLLALDISEFAQYINDFNLYLRIENASTSTGTLSNYAAEFYSDYDAAAIRTINGTGGTIPAGTDPGGGQPIVPSVTDFTVSTQGNLNAELSQIQPNPRAVVDGVPFIEEKPTEAELQRDMARIGGGSGGSGWYGPNRTGLKPATDAEWHNVLKLRGVGTVSARNTRVNQSVDHSLTQYFPPIGNQGVEGSCSCFAFGYYVHTYTMARENGWNLSAVTWNATAGANGRPGYPSDMAHVMSPEFIYHQINEGVDGGSSLIVAGTLLTRMGCAPWQDMPYFDNDCITWPSAAAFRSAARYRARESAKGYWDYFQVGYFVIQSDADINMLKNLIASGYCVTTAITADSDTAPPYPGFYTYLDANDVIDYVSGMAPPSALDHAQTIVGFKDGFAWNKATPDM